MYGKGQVNKKLHGPFCSSMIDFFSTDLGGTATYLMNPNILSQLQQLLLKFPISELDTQQISFMWDQHLENSKTKETVVQQLMKIGNSATVIPFSIFTEMMCQHFAKLKFLESSLELLQQFQLELVSISDEFTIFPGDRSKCLKCNRHGKCVCPPKSIGTTLLMHPLQYCFT